MEAVGVHGRSHARDGAGPLSSATPSTRARRPRRAINYDDFELDDDDEGLQLEPDDDDGWD